MNAKPHAPGIGRTAGFLAGIALWGLSGIGLPAQESPAPAAPPLPGPGLPAPAGSGPEDLIPAAFGIWTDRGGNSWSVEATGNIGRIGSAMVNGGLALLVNEEKFVPHQPMMTRDGKELVIQGAPVDSLPGLRVQRRVRLLDEPGGLRYAELFHNDSRDPLGVPVGLATNFSGNFKTFLSDRGRSEPLILEPSETAVVVLPGASQSSRAFLFTLAGPSGGIRPTLSSQNRYGLTFRFQLDLAPGETAVIVHHVAQVVIPQRFDRRELQQLARPFSFESIRASFDRGWSPHIANARELPEASPREIFARGGVGRLGLEARSQDLVASGEATRLHGKIEGGPIRLKSGHGEIDLPLDRVAAIAGGAWKGDGRSRWFLRDGQVFAGETPSKLGFLPASGARQTLDPVALDRVLLAGTSTEAIRPEEGTALLETLEGDRIKLASEDSLRLRLATPWGERSLSLGELAWIGPAPGGLPGHRVELTDGSALNGFIVESEFSVSGTDFGDIQLSSNRLRYLFTKHSLRPEAAIGVSLTRSSVSLTGDQRLVGTVSETSLPVSVDAARFETAISEIRRLVRLDPPVAEGESARWDLARFRIERWDGGVVVGIPRLEFLSVEVGGRFWQIPFRDVVSVEFPSPQLNPEVVIRIETLVRDLASADWSTRESATRELIAIGYLARSVLRRELASATDPEVERRLERILAGTN